jgi:aminoglycoside phosphotransferase (APT) family kinase protein
VEPPVIDVALASELLREQHSDLAELAIEPLASGWDNVMFRLGDRYTLRLPKRIDAVPLLEFEARWLGVLAPLLPLPISAPVRVGQPGSGYPWPWLVGHWFPGSIIASSPLADPVASARRLGAFTSALHQPAPDDAPENPWRGTPLWDRDDRTLDAIAALEDADVRDSARQVWADAVSAPEWDGPPLWLHGDLHPANILVDDGEISAIIDWGDITSGDPASDLFGAWMMFHGDARSAFRESCGHCDDATWRRARGWALSMCLNYIAHPATTELMRTLGHRILPTVLTEPA